MKCIAIDFGGYSIKMALIDGGVIKKTNAIPAWSAYGLEPRLKDTEEAVYSMLDGEDIDQYRGVAVSMPGIVDPQRKVVTGIYGKYEDSKILDLEKWCGETFGLPLLMQMDSKLALLGEMRYGCAREFDDAVMMIFGTGVGTAVALNGEILESRNHTAGALCSHIMIDMNGRKCTCPNTGCLEAMASGWALEGIVKDQAGFENSMLAEQKEITFKTLSDCCRAKDPTALAVLDHCVRAWRIGILNMIHAFAPQVVVLSGGIMKFEGLFERLSDGLQEYIWDCCGKVEIRKPEKPESSIMYGLYALAEQEWKS